MTDRPFIELYSDTMTRPSPAMRKAMADAEVGDEQKGEDPTTRRLEERVAALLGKEDAVFLPSGTMANQISIAVHCRSGDEIIAPDISHIFTYESAGGAAIAGAQSRALPAERGIFTAEALKAAIRLKVVRHHPRSRLVAVEQTMNLGGGAIWPLADLEAVGRVAREAGLAVHMDGARLLNAVVEANVSAATFAAPCDTVWIDLSKGLGCPVGAVLAGSKEFIVEAWRWKQRLGGALRQSGILAAAGLYALDHNVERLREDNANARRFAELVREIPGVRLPHPRVETNIVYLDVTWTGRSAFDISAEVQRRGARIGAGSATTMRAVTHLDVTRAEVERAAKLLHEVVAATR